MLRTEEQRAARQETMRSQSQEFVRADDPAFEKHYTVQELAKIWNLSPGTVRQIIKREGQACKIGLPGKRKTYRIAESLARQIHARLLAG